MRYVLHMVDLEQQARTGVIHVDVDRTLRIAPSLATSLTFTISFESPTDEAALDVVASAQAVGRALGRLRLTKDDTELWRNYEPEPIQ